MPPAKHTQAQLKGKAGTEPAPQGSAMHTPQHESEASGKMPAGPPRHGHAGIRGNASEEQPTPPPPTREGWLLGVCVRNSCRACSTSVRWCRWKVGVASDVPCRWDFRQLLAARCCGVCAVELRALGICDIVLGVKGDEREEDKKRPLLRHLQVSMRHTFRNRRRSIVALKQGSGLEEVIWKRKSELSHTVTTHVT